MRSLRDMGGPYQHALEVSIVRTLPKSSPKRIATKKVRESLPPGVSFSARLLKIHALTAKKDHNLLI
jgi:hypothetical protein